MFRARAARAPEAVAVVGEDVTLSYRELDRRSDGLAAGLRARGVGPEQVVPVCLERGVELVVAWLGVLKAGGAFLPLDPAHPERRLGGLVADCGARVAIAGRGFAGVERVGVDAVGAVPPDDASDASDASADDLAYLIYTSGTTGRPKGVPVTHRSLLFTLDRVAHAYGLAPGERVLQLAALGSDTALEQVFAALLSGATVVLGGGSGPGPGTGTGSGSGPGPGTGSGTWAPTELVRRLPGLGLAVADFMPAYWHHLLDLLPPGGPAPEGLRLVVVGGDLLYGQDCRTGLDRLPGVRLLNAYGVTEAAVTSLLCEITPEVLGSSAAPVPIGRPLPGVRVYVLDERLRPVRPGGKGEIHLGGPGLARGYWRSPGLTAERFLPDPYAPLPGARMYRTGDAGRWRADGRLEILGRFDEQVKVRGYRVDPAEIEAVLTAHPGVRQARIAADGTSPDGGRALTAYYTTRDVGVPREGIRAFLAERLPEHLVPTAFVPLEAMPLTPAGKIDRRSLPRAPGPASVREPGREPVRVVAEADASGVDASGVERAVGQLWAELLGVELVGPDDDFFTLRGTSLLAMEMLARARMMFGLDVGHVRTLTRALLRSPVLHSFTAALQEARGCGAGSGGATGPGEAAVDWCAEAQLTHAVRQSWSPAPCRVDPAEILLTGATGFCGSHLLRTLLSTTRARIHCLVRAPDEGRALERLQASQQRYLLSDLAEPRVVPLVGDLALPGLGLADGRFTWLAEHLDAVYHLGGRVNFLYPYHQLRAANVGGTREIVRLAGYSRGVPVHYLSTLAVLAGFGAAGVPEVTERTPLAHPDRLGVGYVESKWVAEQLLHNAAADGLPVTVLRTNDVTGGLGAGVMNTGTELCALIRYFADSGTCPAVQLPLDFVPADRLARAMVHIAARAPADGEVYHLTSPGPAALADLADRLRSRGHRIAQLPYGEWVRRLVRFAAGHPTHPITPFVPLFVDRAPGTELSISELYFRPTFPQFDRANAEAALEGSGIELPEVDAVLLDHYLARLEADGFLGAVGRAGPAGRTGAAG
ncbi:thioester reductase domain-containing protein [Kitasatospora sp. SUK 42]|uniref:thioester reductase domain-containing protein n=1 Tax=Kitasatospora sp. SUK 42 TaxID=1588882 RepID=UPI0018CB0CAD|nr:thioester reductase domain-containing protein [Kitasatospora sp. SUK 42]MBV2156467.1 thioester reductase domain-containing protein [Kitasatospora sp. SUK 42]